jgi:hypothetical protein
MSKHLRSEDHLRILDFGPTSASNINFITDLGHSVYMANLVEDATRPEYQTTAEDGYQAGQIVYDSTAFLRDNLDFSGRTFDVVLLWDTLDYLPMALLTPVVERLGEVTERGGQILAFFHSKLNAEDTEFARYHLTNSEQIDLQRVGGYPIKNALTNRQIEGVFKNFSGYKFFLAKDSLREVMVTR